VLEAQQQLFPAEDQLARNMRDELIAIVNLYKALGGGWSGSDALRPEGPDPAPKPVLINDPNGVGGE
jgi:hypothetical protein